MALARRTGRVLAVVAVAVVVAALAGLALAGNFLVDFALNPHSEVSMAATMRSGDVEGLDYAEAPKLDEAYAEEAAAWFDAEKRSVSHVADDGTELLGWELSGVEDGAYADGHTWAVVCHGYIGRPADMAKYAYHFARLGMDVLMPAARGHERNVDAGLIQMGWGDARDLVGWVADIVEQDPDARILLFGTSMGGAEVMMASGMDGLAENVRLIVEDCGYTSVWDEFSLQLDNVFGLPSFLPDPERGRPRLPAARRLRLRDGIRGGESEPGERADALHPRGRRRVRALLDARRVLRGLCERGEGEARRGGRRSRPLRQHRPRALLGDRGRLHLRQPLGLPRSTPSCAVPSPPLSLP